MTEQAIEAAAAPVVEAAAKALTPEAKAIVADVIAHAGAELQKLEARLPELVETAKTDARGALLEAESHLTSVLVHLHGLLDDGTEPAATDPAPAQA